MQLNDFVAPSRPGQHYRLAVLFFILMGLAGWSLWQGEGRVKALNTGTVPGTIPPGGTIPPAPIDPRNGQVRVVHLAPFDAVLANTAVDVCRENNTPVTGFTGLVYLSTSGYQPFPPTIYDWKVMTPGCGALLVDIPPFTLNAGAVLTLYIVGDDDNQSLSTLLSVENVGTYTVWFPIIAQNPRP